MAPLDWQERCFSLVALDSVERLLRDWACNSIAHAAGDLNNNYLPASSGSYPNLGSVMATGISRADCESRLNGDDERMGHVSLGRHHTQGITYHVDNNKR